MASNLKQSPQSEEALTGISAREHLTRSPLVAENVHDERMTIGEEEGPSGAVATNEPMGHLGVKRVKQEIIEEEQAEEVGPTVGPTEAIPRDLPPVAEAEETQVKQEGAELCG